MSTINSSEILRRRDMRDAFTFTIDPADAKDFDDAISFEIINDQRPHPTSPTGEESSPFRGTEGGLEGRGEVSYRIGIHIADVSHYVRPGTEVDDDAYRRGTSVYLVDKVLPMLPEELCNDLCSLKPNEDKLCMSVIFTFTVPLDANGQPRFQKARVLKHKICRTVIRSNIRLNYDEAQSLLTCESPINSRHIPSGAHRVLNGCSSGAHRVLNGCSSGAQQDIDLTTTRDKYDYSETLTTALRTLNALAQQLRAERIANGALTIEQDEMRFRLDKNGYPLDIYFEHPNDAHHLIEEFMLLANRTVAKAVGSGKPFVYRVHDLPDQDKLAAAENFKKKITKWQNGKINGQMVNDQIVNLLTIRAQAKAVYSTYNIGHYGLAFSHYTHFTSPIRRYPDLMVHRLVEKYILTGKKETMTREEMEMMCEHCSTCEQQAAEAERESIKMYQAIWLSRHLGETLAGHISGVTDFGFFVQLDDSKCEGLVHISKLAQHGEYWHYDADNFCLTCSQRKANTHTNAATQSATHAKTTYTLGEPVIVQIVRTDANKGQIDFDLIDN